MNLDETVWRLEELLRAFSDEAFGARRETHARIRALLLEMEAEVPCDRHRDTCQEIEDVLAYSRRAAAGGKSRRSLERDVLRARGALRRLRSGLSSEGFLRRGRGRTAAS